MTHNYIKRSIEPVIKQTLNEFPIVLVRLPLAPGVTAIAFASL